MVVHGYGPECYDFLYFYDTRSVDDFWKYEGCSLGCVFFTEIELPDGEDKHCICSLSFAMH